MVWPGCRGQIKSIVSSVQSIVDKERITHVEARRHGVVALFWAEGDAEGGLTQGKGPRGLGLCTSRVYSVLGLEEGGGRRGRKSLERSREGLGRVRDTA